MYWPQFQIFTLRHLYSRLRWLNESIRQVVGFYIVHLPTGRHLLQLDVSLLVLQIHCLCKIKENYFNTHIHIMLGTNQYQIHYSSTILKSLRLVFKSSDQMMISCELIKNGNNETTKPCLLNSFITTLTKHV